MKFKRAIAYILASCMVLSSMSIQGFVSGSADDAADDGVMRESMTANDYAEEMGLGINLGNTMEAYWLDRSKVDSGAQTIGSNTPQNYETCWGAVVTTQQIIDGMKDSGFNTVRIPVYWGNMMANDGTFTINSEYIGRVKEIVDYCRNAGVYAVINIHHYDEFIIRRYTKNMELDECAKTFKRLWTQIAEYFKDYSDYLVFEGYNEYLGGGPLKYDENGNIVTDQWGNVQVVDLSTKDAYEWTNTLNQAFVDAVRATGGNNEKRMLIASGYWTNIDNTTKSSFIMPTDTVEDRLMVSVHYVDNSYYWMNQIGTEKWKEYAISQCELLRKAFTAKGIPVFIGETTSIYSEDRFSSSAVVKESSAALDYMLRLIKSYGFVPVLWDTNDNFYSRTQYKIKSEDDSEVIKTLSQELADGTFVKSVEPSEITTTDSNPTASDPTASKQTTATTASATTSKATTSKATTTVKTDSSTVKTQAKLTHLKVKSKAKRTINVTWKKVSGAKGYQVQVSKKKSFKKSKIVLSKTLKKTKLKIKNKKIKSGKTYYVRVRAYNTYKDSNNVTKKVYSKWNYVLRKVKVK